MASTTKKRKKPTSSAKRRKKAETKPKISKKAVKIIIALLVVITAVMLIALEGNQGKPEQGMVTLEGEVAFGIDVSSHNGKINWKKVNESAQFAFIRVGYRGYTKGEINLDSKAKYNLKRANSYGIPVGVYFYSQAIDAKEAEEEAGFLIKIIKDYDISLPVVIDYEYPMKNGKHTGRLFEAGQTKKERTAVLNAFCDKIRQAGYTPGIYASSYIFKTEIINKKIPDDVYIWVADYNKKVTYGGAYDIWQYSETGSCGGVESKNVDLNYFYLKNRK